MQKYLILIIYILDVLPKYYNLAYRNISTLLIIQKEMYADAWITKNRSTHNYLFFNQYTSCTTNYSQYMKSEVLMAEAMKITISGMSQCVVW
jgi:hypothetical protein